MDKNEFMLSRVESWKQSGLSQQAYCDQAGIKLGTFSYWIRKSKNEEAQNGGFIALKKPVFALEKYPPEQLHIVWFNKINDRSVILQWFRFR
jgi:hypothetical protein